MASPCVSTPTKSHTGLFSSRTAGGRIPLTPSPGRRSANTTPITTRPSAAIENYRAEPSHFTYDGNLMNHLSRARDSPKSNIARNATTPRKALELGVSDFTLIGTGNTKAPVNTKLRKATAKATLKCCGDRFIACRGASPAFRTAGSNKLDQRSTKESAQNSSVLSDAAAEVLAGLDSLSLNDDSSEAPQRPSPGSVAYKQSLADACEVSLNTRILEFKPPAPESSKPVDLRLQYCRPLKSRAASAQKRRRIATAPERVLDAPGLVDDYYLNLLDWNSNNQVAIALERSVYIWSANEGTVSSLLETTPNTYVSSLKWSADCTYLSVGLGTGEVQIWDTIEEEKVRSMHGHDSRVGVMGWNKHLLSTGSRSGVVFNHDVRIAEHKVAELVSHTSEVCGLEWRPDGAQLATGGNDNLVNIWDARCLSVPKFTKTNHTAAVKALAWCPWSPSLLATGGGSYDRQIHIWNANTGARMRSIDTGSQVTSLRWNPHHRELVSTSGFPDNSLSIWSYPNLDRMAEIPAHESRILHSCLSPDGQMLATAAADESLKFWRVFEKAAAGRASEKAETMVIR